MSFKNQQLIIGVFKLKMQMEIVIGLHQEDDVGEVGVTI